MDAILAVFLTIILAGASLLIFGGVYLAATYIYDDVISRTKRGVRK